MQENWTREDDKKRSQTSVGEFARERERETGGDIRIYLQFSVSQSPMVIYTL